MTLSVGTLSVGILGGGNFGTALAIALAENGHACCLWMRDVEQARQAQETRENKRYLPGKTLPPQIQITSDLKLAAHSDLVFVTVPSSSFRAVSRALRRHLVDNAMLISGTKGIESPGFRLMSAVLAEECPRARIGAISGPNIAEEIADHQYTATVIASEDKQLNRSVQELLHGRFLRVYSSTDLFGVQLAGALKNVYAIVAGMAAAIDVGQNTLSFLITRALAEMSRFAASLGANPLTFLGLAGVGDLLVTCTSPLSRNYQLGYRIGKGATLAQAMDDLGKLAEGVNTLKVVHEKAQQMKVPMPMVYGLYQILYESRRLQSVVEALMAAEQGRDVEFVTR